MSRESDCLTDNGKPKFAFFDKHEAKKVARGRNTRSAYQQAPTQMHVYRCPACRYYHIGHGGEAA